MPRVHLGLAALLLLTGPAVRAQGAAPCVGGDAGGFACSEVDLLAHLNLAAFASPGSPAPANGNEIWGWTDPEMGKEIALVGLSNGVAFVDVTTPEAPVFLGKLLSATAGDNLWRTLRVYQDHVFVGSEAEGHGVQVFDLARLRDVSNPPETFAEDARYTGTSDTHTLVINEATGFLYIAGGNKPNSTGCTGGGLHIVDVRDPLNPTFAGCFDDDGYTHEAQCLTYDGPDPGHVGRPICVAYNADHVAFVDVTDPVDASLISSVTYPDYGFTHQGWFTEDKRHILLDDEGDEGFGPGEFPTARTVVLDVENLDNASYVGAYLASVTSIDHNLYVIGNYAYQSNYEAGFRVLDVTGVATADLTEVAYFDTYPAGDALSFNGQWMNYPFFASGIVVANDINNGLFVLRPTFAGVAGEPGPAPSAFWLSEALPNPTTGRAELALRVATPQHVRASVFDALGRRVAALFDGPVAAGATARLAFEGGSLPPGLYVVHVTGEAFAAVRRVTLLR